MKGGWGEVLVDEQDLEDAEKYIEEFLQDFPEQ